MIHVHVGQCGCQVGDEFWCQYQQRTTSHFSSQVPQSSSSSSLMFPGVDFPAIFVDSEPKVVQNLRSKPHLQQTLFEQNGRGNNWAFGYEGSATLCRSTLEKVRNQVESMDVTRGFHLVHGLSGGTGSGLGSRLVGSLRDTFPKLFLLATSIGGSRFGDTCLQPYNTLLTLKSLHDTVDAICYFQNDEIGQQLLSKQHSQSSSSSKKNDIHFSVHDTNQIIANNLVGLFSPVITAPSSFSRSFSSTPFDAGAFVSNTVPLQGAKYVHVRRAFVPENTIISSASPVKALVQEACKKFSKYRQRLTPVHNFAAHWIARGHLPFEESLIDRKGQPTKRQRSYAKQLQQNSYQVSSDNLFEQPRRVEPKKGTMPCLDHKFLFQPLSLEIMKVMPFASWHPTPVTGIISRPPLKQVL